MQYSGKGILKYQGQEKESFVELAPMNDEIIVYHSPSNSNPLSNISQESFDYSYELKNVRICTREMDIQAMSIKSLVLIHSSSCNSISDSLLNRAFNLEEKNSGLIKRVFRPKRNYIVFKSEDRTKDFQSELSFFDNKLSFVETLSIEFKNKKIRIEPNGKLVLVKADFNLLKIKDIIHNALAISQGLRPTYFAGIFKGEIELNFTRQRTEMGIEPIFKEPIRIAQFLEKYVHYRSQLAKNDSRKFDLFVGYIMDSFVEVLYLENRIICLFTSLEIIDNSGTLNKESLKREFGIHSDWASLIVKVRNKIIHEGFTIKDAVISSYQDIKKYKSEKVSMPFRIEKVAQKKLPSKFFFFLLSIMLSKVCSMISMDSKSLKIAERF